MKSLSFIIPFWGVELYIEECIRSLYNQDIPQEDYEVICVDDCSKDGSRTIVEQLQKEYPTLRLLTHIENKRQGGARNTGLREAQGEYVWFVDSDDIVYPNILGTLLSSARKNNLDILQFDYVRNEPFPGKQEINPGPVIGGESYLFGNTTEVWYNKLVGPWRQIFRREFLEDKHLQFIEGVQFEDTDYMLQAFVKAEKVQHVSIAAYKYRVNTDSTTLAITSPVKLAWRINQLARCAKYIPIISIPDGKKTIEDMLTRTLTELRMTIKLFDFRARQEYRKTISREINMCKPYINWRTWLAVRYGVTWFI